MKLKAEQEIDNPNGWLVKDDAGEFYGIDLIGPDQTKAHRLSR